MDWYSSRVYYMNMRHLPVNSVSVLNLEIIHGPICRGLAEIHSIISWLLTSILKLMILPLLTALVTILKSLFF